MNNNFLHWLSLIVTIVATASVAETVYSKKADVEIARIQYSCTVWP